MSETTDWYGEQLPKLMAAMKAESEGVVDTAIMYAYTVNEDVPLRESPNGKAKKLKRLLIESKLRVISDIPRWYQVEYEEDSVVITGWISKRNAEISDT